MLDYAAGAEGLECFAFNAQSRMAMDSKKQIRQQSSLSERPSPQDRTQWRVTSAPAGYSEVRTMQFACERRNRRTLGRVLMNRPTMSAFGQAGNRADIAE